jgi:hypothetical protein
MMHTKLFGLAVFLTLSFGWLSLTATAGSISTNEILASYTVKFSEKEAVLIDPGDMFAEKVAGWDHPFQRIADRNMPWIEITNEGESTGQITQFLLTIGDADFHFSDDHFGALIMPSDSNPSDIGIDADTQSNDDQLVVNLTDFEPGERVRFRIDLDPDDPDAFPHPDFRRVLFDMNSDPEDLTDNAQVQLRYSNGVITADLEQTLRDFEVDGPIFFESFIRPYSVMEPVGVFVLSDEQVIPEPSTCVLAALLAVTAAASARRGRSHRNSNSACRLWQTSATEETA